MQVGDKVHMFDPTLWGGRDQGDNSQFYMPATILKIGHATVDVQFTHDGRRSNGHFFTSMLEYKRIS